LSLSGGVIVMSKGPLRKRLRKFVGLYRKYNLPTKHFLSLKPDKQYMLWTLIQQLQLLLLIEALEMFLTSKEKSRK
jgi:hypothetical protein